MMETGFVFFAVIVLGVAFAGLLASHPTQMPGSPHGNMSARSPDPPNRPA